MQGIIFNALEDFVLEKADMELWNSIIEDSEVASGGAYTFGVNYDDAEIVALATTLCEKLGVSLQDGLVLFGEYLFDYLVERGPIELQSYKNTQVLLTELEDVVHKDVKRIHPEAYTPFFHYEPNTESQGELKYQSKRQLCAVAAGLVKGAAKHYKQSVELEHTQCMHDGHDECIWKLTFAPMH